MAAQEDFDPSAGGTWVSGVCFSERPHLEKINSDVTVDVFPWPPRVHRWVHTVHICTYHTPTLHMHKSF